MKVIYLHGFASSPASSKAQFFSARFAGAGYEVIIPALDGGDFFHMTLNSQLEIVERAAGAARVVLMGSSLGGYLTALYAARHPGQVSHAIMMAPAFGFARRFPVPDEWKRTGVVEMFHYGDKCQRSLSYNLIQDGLEYEDYPAVSQPSLLLHGALDPVVPVSLSEEFVRRNPASARLRVYPQSGHELTDVVEEMWAEIEAFLADVK